jgi:hypothetical protein
MITFKGIPYAKAERFTAPVKANSWTRAGSSTTYGPVCPVDVPAKFNDKMNFPFSMTGVNENSQSLNIWSKGINDNKKACYSRASVPILSLFFTVFDYRYVSSNEYYKVLKAETPEALEKGYNYNSWSRCE